MYVNVSRYGLLVDAEACARVTATARLIRYTRLNDGKLSSRFLLYIFSLDRGNGSSPRKEKEFILRSRGNILVFY